ncbi:hypothetical protein WN55_10252 [Dufourea novaeangliae]|uniref:Uncharacterized protein n=1 Tax=Dufourea novaeangliae TaxID=178035 RepID=A0A154P3E3_DUFNO|nr:hypothetical protein WN55_10252 [Dufourea novaeangliae]
MTPGREFSRPERNGAFAVRTRLNDRHAAGDGSPTLSQSPGKLRYHHPSAATARDDLDSDRGDQWRRQLGESRTLAPLRAGGIEAAVHRSRTGDVKTDACIFS